MKVELEIHDTPHHPYPPQDDPEYVLTLSKQETQIVHSLLGKILGGGTTRNLTAAMYSDLCRELGADSDTSHLFDGQLQIQHNV